MNTKTMKWLLQREFWEYKGSMFWAPLIVAGLLVLLMGGGLLYGLGQHFPSRLTIDGHTLESGGHTVRVAIDLQHKIARVASSAYLGAAAPLFALMAVVIFSYCLGTLHDERRDRSILFWKSLPVSDGMTVLSKAATAMIVAPLITIVLATVSSLLLLFVLCLAVSLNGVHMFGIVLASPDLYLSPLRLLALLPVYVVWALPTVGWLMLVSSWARSKPILWAVGVPLIGLLVVKWATFAMDNLAGEPSNLMHYASGAAARILTGVVPGIWYSFTGAPAALRPSDDGFDPGSLLTSSYGTLATADAWIGFAIGAAMLYAAMRLRRYRDEG